MKRVSRSILRSGLVDAFRQVQTIRLWLEAAPTMEIVVHG